MSERSWFKRLALISTLMALCVVVLGAYVRLSDAGLGCPDWPGCYGTLTVPQSEQAIAHAQQIFPDSQVVVHKAWKEMAHRYLAGTLGLLILGSAVLAWRLRTTLRTSLALSLALVGIVGFQAALGMWTVTLLLKPAIVTAHLLGGMTILGMLTWIAHRQVREVLTPQGLSISQAHFGSIQTLARFGLLVLAVQIALGGWTSTNYAALACNDFPTCHGVWMPSMDIENAFHVFRALGEDANGKPLSLEALSAIQWMHRLGALCTVLYVLYLVYRLIRVPALKYKAILLGLLLLVQVMVGIANLMLHLPIALAVAHNAGAALLLMTLVTINSTMTPFRAR